LGKTNAPVDTSKMCGVWGDDGLAANTTLAKWVGTATFGGEPITSYVYVVAQNPYIYIREMADHSPLPVCFVVRKVKWHCKDVHIGESVCEATAPIFKIRPV
jgi:hypothetical protein